MLPWDLVETGIENAPQNRLLKQKVDIRQEGEIRQALDEVLDKWGRVDVLINNAGITRDRTLLKMSDEEWFDVIDVNLNGTYRCTKAILPIMKSAGYGRIISASSVNAHLGAFGQTNYSASKAALIGFTRALAREVGKYGITANAIAPGFVATEMTQQMPKEVRDAAIALIPVGRIGETREIAATYLFLASEDAGFINGEVVNINGGIIS